MTSFIDHWGWLVFGLVMLLLEIVVPLTFFLWLGVSAMVTALVSFAIPMSWQSEALIFATLSLVSIWVSRRYLVNKQTESEQPHLNQRAEQYIGRMFSLTEAIHNGYGKISADDTRWRVKGPDLPTGAAVKVVGYEGSVFTVEAVKDASAAE